ncbi:hypothetical protein [Pedobacter nyackensis]|uniref:TerB family tellurite resistance protein n=1 Tax=Pedobacter nyackensis TaxID=475255 RepID=A0A1W2DWG4_9SPHI|nr:hypothetical protein [Pedobacter nyackensis]SMD01432.1 hypothetical protein SAMN04488101_108175 [Pedobacter nyackensis]
MKSSKLKLALCLFLGMMVMAPTLQAQTWSEWFSQKKTQKKYLLQQIAALQVYIGYAKKGYDIVGSGLQTVKDISNGEFKLHNSFISSLKQVSPAIRNDVRIAEIIALQISIVKAFGGIKNTPLLSADQLGYITLVYEEVIRDCFTDLEELLLVITSGKLEMKDDERLVRLNSIYENMLDKSTFTQSFCTEAVQLIRQRELERNEIDAMIRMFHFKE